MLIRSPFFFFFFKHFITGALNHKAQAIVRRKHETSLSWLYLPWTGGAAANDGMTDKILLFSQCDQLFVMGVTKQCTQRAPFMTHWGVKYGLQSDLVYFQPGFHLPFIRSLVVLINK